MRDSGNTRRTARDIFFSQGKAVVRETIGGLSNRRDFFRVTLKQSSNFTVRLTNLRADANVAILGKGQVWQNSKFGRQNEKIDEQLEPGTYFIRVSSPSPFRKTSYRLVLTAQPSLPSPKLQDIYLSSDSIDENSTDLKIGNVLTIDPDTQNRFTYELIPGFGDYNAFTLNNNQLFLKSSVDYEAKRSFQVQLRVSYSEGGNFVSRMETFFVKVNNINEHPSELNLSNNRINENVAIGAEIGVFSTIDPDLNDTFTYSLTNNSTYLDNTSFQINNNRLLTAAPLNYEAKSSYAIAVKTTDKGGLSTNRILNIFVNDLNEDIANVAPTDILLSNSSINENVPANTLLGNLTSIDSNIGDAHIYSLVSGTGDTDNDSFRIVGNQLLIKASPDFENKPSYSILVQTMDQGGLGFNKSFTISINNLSQTPIPQLSLWENNMQIFGHEATRRLTESPDFDTKLGNVFYDGAWVFSQIAQYTGSTSWYTSADLANDINKKYIFDAKGKAQGFRNFSRGLEDRYYRTGDPKDKEAIALLATSASYTAFNTPDERPEDPTGHWRRSREVAYGINTLLSAKRVGLFEESDDYFINLFRDENGNFVSNGVITLADNNIGSKLRARLAELVNFAFDHLNQMFVSENTNDNSLYVKPFMVGLTARALIEYDNEIGDLRVAERLPNMLDEMRQEAWVESSQLFRYIDRIPSNGMELDPYDPNDPNCRDRYPQCLLDPAADLNLLIAPAYQWAYSKTGETRFREYADELFVGDILNNNLDDDSSNKQFNQNYFWSFDYVESRKVEI